MTEPRATTGDHRHSAEAVHLVLQRGGVPYEVERLVCTSCGRVIDEKPVKRAAA
jgi:hypothetical protein